MFELNIKKCLWAVLAIAALATAAAAQEAAVHTPESPVLEADAMPPRRPPAFLVGTAGTWRPEANFDDSAGKVGYSDSEIFVRSNLPLSENAFLSPMLTYRHTYFSWSSGHDFLPKRNPWTDLHRLAFGADLRYVFNEELSALVGAGMGVAGEANALADAWFGHARAALLVSPSEDLTVGMGVHWYTGLEYRRYIPLPYFHWRIAERWLLATERGGVRLGFSATDALNLGAFGGYDGRRWRLGSGATPRKGYARLSGYKAGLDAKFDLTPAVSLRAAMGADMFRRLSAEDRKGRRVARDKLGTEPFFEVGLNVAF